MSNSSGKTRSLVSRILAGTSTFRGGVVTLAAGTMITQVISFIIQPIVSRIYLPEAFGVLAFFSSSIMILSPLRNLRYDRAIVMAKTEEDAVNLTILSVLLNLLFSGLLMVVILLFGDDLLHAFEVTSLLPWVWLIPVSTLLNGISTVIQNWQTRQKQYIHLTAFSVLNGGSAAGLKVTGGFLGYNLGYHLVIYTGLTHLIRMLYQVSVFIASGLDVLRREVSLAGIRYVFGRYNKFAIYSTPTSLLIVASQEMIIFLLTFFTSTAFLGLYNKAYTLLMLPVYLMAQSVTKVFYKELSVRYNEGRGAPELVEDVISKMVSIALPPLVLLALFAPDIFSFFLGDNWKASGEISRILLPWVMMTLVASPLSLVFPVVEKQYLSLYTQIGSTILRAGGFLLGMYLSDDPYVAISLFVAASVISRSVMVYLSHRVIGASMKRTGANILRNIVAPLAAVIVLSIPALLVTVPQWMLFAWVIVQGLVVLFLQRKLLGILKR